MRKISLLNPTVISELESFSNWFFGEYDYKSLDSKKFVSVEDPHELTAADEYLDHMLDMGEDHDGYPPSLMGHELAEFSGKQEFDQLLVDKIDRIVYGLEQILCVRRSALSCYYPVGGYIGWHTNWNAPGYNVLFSYSVNGDGEFKFRDPDTHIIHRIPDEKGVWTAKVGYYGARHEPELHCWHAATTNTPRLTFAYTIPDKDLWEMMVDDLEDSEG
jgi:hypothetical protein